MIGAIAGDIIGSIYEFQGTKDYDFRLFESGSDFTDDTILTVAVADCILRHYPQSSGRHQRCTGCGCRYLPGTPGGE
jgi:ADP-ribosylglycohydrolase